MLGTAALAAAKCIENMELAHNIIHGQWDWMNDPEIHSATWEWDMVGPSSHWRSSHNHRHHKFTNIVGMDDDLGFGVLRVTRDRSGRRQLVQPLRAVMLAAAFEWGVAFHDLYAIQESETTEAGKEAHRKALLRKMARQAAKDYLCSFRRWASGGGGASSEPTWWPTAFATPGLTSLSSAATSPTARRNSPNPSWKTRQSRSGTYGRCWASANFQAGAVLSFMSGHLCYQIEHHLFPDLPSNRLPEISVRVRALCDKYDLPYTTGSFLHQYWLTVRTICKLALPAGFMSATSDDAPETASENKFRYPGKRSPSLAVADGTRRSGLATAIVAHRDRRQAS